MPHLDPTCWIAKVAGKPVAGILDMRGIAPDTDPSHWLSYLDVDDAGRCVAEIDVPDFGRIAIGADATGALLAWAKRRASVIAPARNCHQVAVVACNIGASLPP